MLSLLPVTRMCVCMVYRFVKKDSLHLVIEITFFFAVVKVPAQVLMETTTVDDRQQQSFSSNTYPELLYAHLLDADGSRLTYTHFTSRVPYRSLIDLSFNRPIFIQRNKVGVIIEFCILTRHVCFRYTKLVWC